MGRHRAFDETEALTAAMQTFWELGFEAASIDELTERTGLSRSSLYAAFGSKEELFTSALRLYLEQQVAANLGELERGDDGLDAIRRFFGSIADNADEGGTWLGCLAANTMAELGIRGKTQRPLIDGYRTRMTRAFETALERAAHAGQIDSRDLHLRARALATLAPGLFVALRGNPDAAHEAREVADAVDALLRSWTPARAMA